MKRLDWLPESPIRPVPVFLDLQRQRERVHHTAAWMVRAALAGQCAWRGGRDTAFKQHRQHSPYPVKPHWQRAVNKRREERESAPCSPHGSPCGSMCDGVGCGEGEG